jgi:hypothetical protein
MRSWFPLIVCIALITLCVGDAAWATQKDVQKETPRHIPTYSECQKLASPTTTPAVRAQLTQLFKTGGMFCSMLTPPIPVQHVFSAGQGKAQLRLVMGTNDHYVVDGKTLMDVLLPDRAGIPPTQMIMLAGQLISMLGEMFSSNMDADTMHHVSGKVGAFGGVVGINARSALQQIDNLRAQMRLSENDVEPCFWLVRLSKIEPPPTQPQQQQNAQAPHTGPGWMQKLLGAGQHILGTFTQNE